VEVNLSLDRLRFLRAVALLGAAGAYVTIVLGGTVRGMGAGLACPDWPLCHGSLVPDLSDSRIAIEYAHRLAAAATSACLLLTFALTVLWFRAATRLVVLSFTSLGILATQVVVGALTITSGLDWIVVTIHLALATATFASAVVVALLSRWSPPSPEALGVPVR
jgi:heme a synthase